jgi:hypothetical protein
MGFNLNKYKGGKYFTATALTTDVNLTVDSVEERRIGRDEEKEDKLVLTFREDRRALPLNRTRTQNMEDLFGPNTDDWCGKRVRLRRVRSTFGSAPWSIIIERASSARPAQPEPRTTSDDDIPPPDSPDWETADAE